MTRYPTTRHLLAAWGRSYRHLPAKNEQLKNGVVAQLQPVEAAMPVRHLPWLAMAFTGLAVIVFFITSPITIPTPSATLTSGQSATSNLAPSNGGTIGESFGLGTSTDVRTALPSFLKGIAPNYYPDPQPPSSEIPITDNREFLKTNYYVTMRTRQVEELTRRVQTIVRGFGGRIDATTSSPRRGMVTFVVPASTFEVFRTEVQSLVGARFFVEQTYTENLLSQKQGIEQQLGQIETTLTQLLADKNRLTATHNNTTAALRSQLNAITKELAAIQAEHTDDPARQAAIAAREQELTKQRGVLNARLANENTTYTRNLSSLEAQIRGAQANKEQANAQDQHVLDTVATVRGTISLSWISVWGILDLYLPTHWFSLALLAAAIVAYLVHRRRSPLIIV